MQLKQKKRLKPDGEMEHGKFKTYYKTADTEIDLAEVCSLSKGKGLKIYIFS